MSDIKIIPMTEEHIEQVYAIYADNFSEKWSEKSLRLELTNDMARTLVAVVDCEVIGFLNLRHVMGEGDINNIAVKEKYRKNHVGRSLMESLFELAKLERITSYTLEVRASNKAAIAFYESIGFEVIGERKNYYTKPIENAVLYRYNLKENYI